MISTPESSDSGTPDLEFWFEFGSNCSYLSVMRIEEEARRHGVRVVRKPFLLGPIFRAQGMETSPFVAQKQKGAYVQHDMARQCAKHGLPVWTPPSTFPRVSVLAARIALLGAKEPWIASFCRRVMLLNFVKDQDIDQAEVLGPALAELGLPAAQVVEQAKAESMKTRLRRQTDEALARGISGAPIFFVGKEMFWGNDRIEDALLFVADGHRNRNRSDG